MKTIKKNAFSIILFLFELLAGVLLLVDPAAFTSVIIILIGAALLVAGAVLVVRYFREEVEKAVQGQNLFKGLAALLLGAFCAFGSNWFLKTFPAISALYGAAILLVGLAKVQFFANKARQKCKKCGVLAAAGFVTLVCAVLVLWNPFASVETLWLFTGVSLLAEAVLDVVSLILVR